MTSSMRSFLLLFFFFPFSNCDSSDPAMANEYRFHATLTVGGITRTYLLVLPSTYYGSDTTTFPLVVGMHGTGGSASQFDRDYGVTEKANSTHFIVAYPEGVQREGRFNVRTWNAGTCCDYAMENNIDDVGFIRALIDLMISDYRANARRVYITGMSNGGMLAYRLACEMPEKIAAMAAVSCSMMVDEPCDPSRSVPILHMHSKLDTKIPSDGGIGIGGYQYPPIDSVLDVWSRLNECESLPQVEVDNAAYKLTKWSTCDSNVTIQYYLTQDGGHSWPGGLKPQPRADEPSTAIDATDLMWTFFEQYQLP
jgi:polyhydroxybutyrate depolymerase